MITAMPKTNSPEGKGLGKGVVTDMKELKRGRTLQRILKDRDIPRRIPSLASAASLAPAETPPPEAI